MKSWFDSKSRRGVTSEPSRGDTVSTNLTNYTSCRRSSIGRASALQADGCGSKSRRLLQKSKEERRGKIELRLKNIESVEDFTAAVNKCAGDVWLESGDGDRFNLKSSLSCYVALSRLISERGEELELFCSDYNDEPLFFKFFHNHPESM